MLWLFSLTVAITISLSLSAIFVWKNVEKIVLLWAITCEFHMHRDTAQNLYASTYVDIAILAPAWARIKHKTVRSITEPFGYNV